MRVEPTGFLQRSICYDRERHLTFLVSLGYVVQVFPNIVLPRELERTEQTFSAWNGVSQRNEFDFDIRDPYRSICKKPILFFLKTTERVGNATLGSYARARGKDYLKRKFLCFPRLPPLNHVHKILVLGYPLTKKWHLVLFFSLLFPFFCLAYVFHKPFRYHMMLLAFVLYFIPIMDFSVLVSYDVLIFLERHLVGCVAN